MARAAVVRNHLAMTITQDDAQAWLEQQADHYMSSGGLFSSDMLLGITAYGIKVEADLGSVRSAGLYERFKPKALVRDEVAMTNHFIPFQAPKAFRNAGVRGCFPPAFSFKSGKIS